MTQNKRLSLLLILPILVLAFGFSAEAKRKKQQPRKKTVATKKAAAAPLCQSDIATTTMYFLPHIKDYCNSPSPCEKFKAEVRMQGSGSLGGNKLLVYSKKSKDRVAQKTLEGGCATAIGAAGVCLTPFISVAADMNFYSAGDIIDMPSLKGKKITLPDGSTMIHPGYLIVQDSGGAIKGKNRFDFFTGSLGLRSSLNAFGANGFDDPEIATKEQCSADKKFTVIRRGSLNYQQSLASIESAVQDGSSKTQVAGFVAGFGGSK